MSASYVFVKMEAAVTTGRRSVVFIMFALQAARTIKGTAPPAVAPPPLSRELQCIALA
jgi:hypothetical protein